MKEFYFAPEIRYCEWKEKVQSVFDKVRKFPFSTEKSTKKYNSLSENIKSLLNDRKGSCSPKHYVLGLYYESLGISVEYLDFPFYWQRQEFHLSSSLMKLAKNLPPQHHTALLISSPLFDKPKFVDATWDSFMAGVGMPVNKIDLFRKDCLLGIVPSGPPEIYHSAADKWNAQGLRRQNYPKKETVGLFYKEFDTWLKKLRTIS